MAQEINVPQDEEFKKELRDALEKPTKWYLERVDRAVRANSQNKDERENLCQFLAKVEAAYIKRLLKAWTRDPEAFPESVRRLEDVVDLRRKICP